MASRAILQVPDIYQVKFFKWYTKYVFRYTNLSQNIYHVHCIILIFQQHNAERCAVNEGGNTAVTFRSGCITLQQSFDSVAVLVEPLLLRLVAHIQ